MLGVIDPGCAQAIVAERRPVDFGEPLLQMPGAFAASPAALQGWTMHAAADRGCVYARVERLRPGGVGEMARRLYRAGLLVLRQRRCASDPTLFDYSARRTTLAYAQAVILDEDQLSAGARALLDVLERCAEAQAPCPRNAQLAGAIGTRSASAVSRALHELKVAGMVAVGEGSAPDFVRVVTIVASGATTGRPA